MTLTTPARLGLVGALGVLSLVLGCGGTSGGVTNPDAAGGGAGSGGGSSGSTGSAGTGGSSTAGTAGAAGGAGQGGGGAGGTTTVGDGGVPDAAAGGSTGSDGGPILTGIGGAPGGVPVMSRHTKRPLGTVTGAPQGYWEYLPVHYGNGDRFPLIVFGHGSGENGDGSTTALQKVLAHGPPKNINVNNWPETRPFVVLSPQHNPAGAAQCPSVAEIDTFLTFAMGHYSVDPTRVYFTGLSCGANALWSYLGVHLDEKLAAVVPIAGDARAAFQMKGCQLGRVPIWDFHGLADTNEPPAWETVPIMNLMACTNPAPIDVSIITYPGADHTRSFDMTYDGTSVPVHDIYAWMLTHHK